VNEKTGKKIQEVVALYAQAMENQWLLGLAVGSPTWSLLYSLVTHVIA
jgi:hypothetical protein